MRFYTSALRLSYGMTNDFVRNCPSCLPGSTHHAQRLSVQAITLLLTMFFKSLPGLLPCVTLYQGLEVVFIAVRCSLEEVDRREKMRADRRAGMARY